MEQLKRETFIRTQYGELINVDHIKMLYIDDTRVESGQIFIMADIGTGTDYPLMSLDYDEMMIAQKMLMSMFKDSRIINMTQIKIRVLKEMQA